MLVLFGYMVILTIIFKDMVIIMSIIPIAVQILINLGLCVQQFNKDRSLAYTYLLSAFLVLLIGYPSCWGFSDIGNQLKK
jgi:bacteriorhodopsin